MFFKPFAPPVPPTFPDYTVDIRDFGAVADLSHNSGDAINNAIVSCSEHGGGVVLVPKGEWKTGPIHLKSNVNLHLEAGSVVHFSDNFYDFLPVVFGILGGIRCYSASHFIYAYKQQNIAITGEGTFDGHGENWWHMKHHQPGMEDLMRAGKEGRPLSERVYDKPEDGVRPRMLQFAECENILIEGVTLTNSPSWTVHPAWCKNLTVRDIKIKNPRIAPNTDGINLESCKRVLVENCVVDTGDDALCLKAGRDEDAHAVGIPCEDVEIRNCTALGGHGGITIGSETSASVRNAYIHDCTFGELYSAIRVKSMKGRGGFVENIDYENITIDKAKEAIIITLRYAGEPLDDQSVQKTNMTKMRNFSIKNFKCKKALYGIDLLGDAQSTLDNICVSDVTVTADCPIRAEFVSNLITENTNLLYEKAQDGEF